MTATCRERTSMGRSSPPMAIDHLGTNPDSDCELPGGIPLSVNGVVCARRPRSNRDEAKHPARRR